MSYRALFAYYRAQAERFGAACRAHLLLVQHHPRPRPGALDLWTDEATTAARHAAHYADLSTTPKGSATDPKKP